MLSRSELKLKANLHHYFVKVVDIYDGDTITVDIDLGVCTWLHAEKIRLWRINTPELQGADREAGLRARDFLRDLLVDRAVIIRTILDKRGDDSTEKYGRLLGEVLIPGDGDDVVVVNDLLVEKGFAEYISKSGSRIRSLAAPEIPDCIPCPYCGQERRVDPRTLTVVMCPNCLDPAYALLMPETS